MLKAVILAGGRGERLKPITDSTPKPMIIIKGKPFLEYQLAMLKKNKINEILLCVGYRKDTIMEYFGDGSRFGLKIEYSIENQFLGTGGALKLAKKYLPADFILLYGDSYLPIDYVKLADAWSQSSSSGLVVCYDNSLRIAANNICLNPDGSIASYSKRYPDGKANYVEAGVSILRKEVLNLIPEKRAVVSLEEEIFPALVKAGLLNGYPVNQRYYDIGTPGRLKEIEGIL
jgi:NDP-sugar pyrophosphorylase family protein